MTCRSFLRVMVFFGVSFLLSSCGSGGSSSNDEPVAVAMVLGTGSSQAVSNRHFTVRAGTEVLLSGKNSSAGTDPLAKFEWEQVDHSGIAVNLNDRTKNSQAFTAPWVSSEIELAFELTMTNADGLMAKDTVFVTVLPIGDVDQFLSHLSATPSVLTLLAVPNTGEVTGSAPEVFTVEIGVVAHWRNRDGDQDQLLIKTDSLSGQFPAHFEASADPIADTETPLITYPLPPLNADEINGHFDDFERHRRLEAAEINSAYLALEINIVPVSTSINFRLFAVDNQQQLILPAAISHTVSASGHRAVTPSQATLMDTALGQFNSRLLVDELKAAIGVESSLSAQNYYRQIDPNNLFEKLDNWLLYAGFIDSRGVAIDDPSILNTKYVNNYDLGFGRDMWVRKAPNGNVYAFVTNFHSLELAIREQDDFATVVMEYSENPDPNGVNEKIVKFYAYVFDKENDEYIRANTMNFDGRGEKPVPGVCTVCHDQSKPIYRDFNTVADADLGSTFLPWDLDSLLYTHAAENRFVSPNVNPANIPTSQQFDASREGQEATFKAMNEVVLSTYLQDPIRHDASIRLLHCMYGDADFTAPLDELPADRFDSQCVQPGWDGQEALYFGVYARYCRSCHSQLADPVKDFDTYDDFIASPLLENYVFQQGIMPLARLTMDRFWLDFRGGIAAADLLRDHLASTGHFIDSTPGEPKAFIQLSASQSSRIGDTIQLQGAGSLFVDRYHWSLESDCGSVAEVDGSRRADASFTIDTSPCLYTINLQAENDLTTVSASANVVVDRSPAAVNFAAPLIDYQTGDTTLTVDIAAQLDQIGDGGIRVIINDAAAPYHLVWNDRVVDNNDGTVSVTIPALKGLSDSFEYHLEDSNGTLASSKAVVTLAIPAITPSLSAGEVTASSATLQWTIDPGFTASHYTIYRDGDAVFQTPDGQLPLTYIDSGLATDTNYHYEVVAAYKGEGSDHSNTIAISTENGVPSGLTLENRTSTSSRLNWSPGAGGEPLHYDIYREGVLVGDDITPPFDDVGLLPNVAYDYTVVANFAGSIESAPSVALPVVTLTEAPVLNSVTAVTISSANLSWDGSNNQGSVSYQVQNYGTPVGPVTTDTSMTLTHLSSNRDYHFTVVAAGLADVPAVSNEQTIRTLVSYFRNIVSGPVSNQACFDCHDDSFIKDAFKNKSCVTDDIEYGDCDPANMPGYRFSAGDKSLIERWISDGKKD